MEATNRLKGLDLADRLPEELRAEFPNVIQEAVTKTIPEKKECKKAKCLSEEALQVADERREVEGKGEKGRYTQLNAEFQRIGRRDKKAFLSEQRTEIEGEKQNGERLEISTRKLEIPREHIIQEWVQ